MKAYLVLEDGTVYEGLALGASGMISGEVVFNTSMTGYQEVLTDPSYKGHIVAMTYPLIGNYGTNDEDMESLRPVLHGLVVKEACSCPSNWRSSADLQDLLSHYGVIAIEGIDTRSLTRRLRSQGTMKGVICSGDRCGSDRSDFQRLVQIAKECPDVDMPNLVRQVTTPRPYRIEGDGLKVTVVDYGVKQGIVRSLADRGCDVTVVPATASPQQVLETEPDGILLSNGPGDPRYVDYGSQTVKELLGIRPIFGICLGHQILCQAVGAGIFKMKFGHRGGNHPVKELSSGKVYITSQNHGYAVDKETIDPKTVEVTHINLNDGTVEGIRHTYLPAFSVQYHPEASPGPRDSQYLLDKFIGEISRFRSQER